MRKASCILLLADSDYLAEHASAYCQLLFDIKYEGKYSRNSKQLDPAIHALLENRTVDYLFNFLSPVIVPGNILKRIKITAINFHPAPPKWPGVGSASYALFEKDQTFGTSAHLMQEAVDSGKIIKTITFPVLSNDTADTLFDRSLAYTLILFYDVLFEISHAQQLPRSSQRWARKARTRAGFEKWMMLSLDDSEDTIRRKIASLKSKKFPGPYIEIAGHLFELSARERRIT